jgi:hypothetical protein
VHALHVPEDVAAQIEHDLLADPLHQVDLNELEEISRDQHGQVDGGQARDALRLAPLRKHMGEGLHCWLPSGRRRSRDPSLAVGAR